MNVLELIEEEEGAIVEDAFHAVAWLANYERDGEERTRARLRSLLRMVAEAVRTQDLAGLVAHAERIARERHAAGYDRREVLRAVTALEEAIWFRILGSLTGQEQAWALGLVGTALDQARDVLSHAFAALGDGEFPPHVDLSRLFRGAAIRNDGFDDDMVMPV